MRSRGPARSLNVVTAILTLGVAGCLAFAQALPAENGAPPNDGASTEPEPEGFQFPTGLARMFEPGYTHFLARDPAGARELVEERDGLAVQFAMTTVGQYATESLTSQQGLATFTWDFAGAVRIFGSPAPDDTEGFLTWWVRGGRPIGAPRESDLSEDVGSAFFLNSNLLSDEVFVQEAYWVQAFGHTFYYTVGRIDPTFLYDFNRIANDEREQFLSIPLVNSATIPFPEAGLGIDATWHVTDLLSVKGGVHQSNGRANAISIDKLRGDELFWVFEADLSPTFENLGEGTYRFMCYYTGAFGDQGAGFSMSFDQEIGGGLVPFFRFGYDGSGAADFRRAFSGGIGLETPFGRDGDLVAIGYAWGDPTDDDGREESIIEAFYRLELTDFARLTPDVQFVINPAFNRSDDLVVVFGLRLQIVF